MFDVVSHVVVEFWIVLGVMAPYLLFGFLMAGAFSVLISPEWVERHLGGSGVVPVAKASLLGVPLPLCSCGVIPVAASLRRHGASRGATTSFLLSTPQTGVDSILVTYGLLGPVYAVFRPLAAFLTGVIGGSLVSLLVSDDKEADKRPAPCDDECRSSGSHRGKLVQAISYGFVTLPRDIGKDLLIGLVIAGGISALVPPAYFEKVGSGIGAMLAMMLVGIPMYVCASASVPVAAALIAKGISPGAALVFLITGPATNAATIATVRKIMGWRTAVIYLATVALTALGSGILLDRIFTFGIVPQVPHIHEMAAGWFGTISALVLLGVLGYATLEPKLTQRTVKVEKAESSVTLTIEGMTCDHCVESVRRALLACSGVTSAEVQLRTGRAAVGGDNLDVPALRRAVEGLGYTVKRPEAAR